MFAMVDDILTSGNRRLPKRSLHWEVTWFKLSVYKVTTSHP